MPRALELPLNTRKITTLVGIRRSGKTYILYDTMRRLESRGVDRRQMIFLNFEDDRLLPIESRELDLILHAHVELYPDFADRKKYFFLDEIQDAPRWESYVRRLHDTADVQIFLTGSSSHLLARELATSLRGRTISYEVFPLSFAEFLRFRGLQHEPYSAKSDSRMAAALNEYLTIGGLPEVVLADPDLRPRILKPHGLPARQRHRMTIPESAHTAQSAEVVIERTVLLHQEHGVLRHGEQIGFRGSG